MYQVLRILHYGDFVYINSLYREVELHQLMMPGYLNIDTSSNLFTCSCELRFSIRFWPFVLFMNKWSLVGSWYKLFQKLSSFELLEAKIKNWKIHDQLQKEAKKWRGKIFNRTRNFWYFLDIFIPLPNENECCQQFLWFLFRFYLLRFVFFLSPWGKIIMRYQSIKTSAFVLVRSRQIAYENANCQWMFN